MLKTSFVPLEREQFKLLRKAKKMVKEEFSEDLVLHDKNVLENLYRYALSSEDDQLFDLFNQLHNDADLDSNDSDRVVQLSNINNPSKKPTAYNPKEVKVGDIVDGEKCTGYYRGQPVFSAIKK